MTNHSIEAVIFDLGGVLVRTEDPEPRRKLAEELGMNYREIMKAVFDSGSGRQATLGQITTEQHWEALRIRLGMSSNQFSRAEAMFWAGDRVDQELVDAIRNLRPQYRTGLLSNAWDDLREVLVDEWKIADAFDRIVISAEEGLKKPDPRIYRLALERLDAAPEQAVFVDDIVENVEGARRVGMHAIHFKNPEQVRRELDQLLGAQTG